MMKVQEMSIGEIKPYENNPRINENGVDAVANSIREFGWKQPIVVDKDNIIIVGHTRYLASKQLKLKKVPVVVANDLTPEQVKAYRLADNKTNELTEWDEDLLGVELSDIEQLSDIDMTDFGFENIEDEIELDEDNLSESSNPYTDKKEVPQYEIQGEEPDISELVDGTKTQELINKIEESNVPNDVKRFLKAGAMRHLKFNYAKIAEYYAHASKEVQDLFEDSALVILDYDDAIKKGYIKFKDDIEAVRSEEIDE